jgi:amino acid permease
MVGIGVLSLPYAMSKLGWYVLLIPSAFVIHV